MTRREGIYEKALEETREAIEKTLRPGATEGLSARTIYLVWLAISVVGQQAGILEQMIRGEESDRAGRLFYRMLQTLVDGARKTDQEDA